MPKKKLLEDIKLQPARFYRMPADVARDRRFDDGERLEILSAWAASTTDEAVRQQINEVAGSVQSRAAHDHAAE